MRIALTRAVPRSIERCELTHLARQPIDFEVAVAQHSLYEEMLKLMGCIVERLPEEPEMPDSVFVEDTAVVLDELAVITRPGAESRRGEVTSAEKALRPYRRLTKIESPGTLDGGDVLCVGRQLFAGLSRRSNGEGIEQLRYQLEPYGYSVTSVPFRECLHLKSAVTEVSTGVLLLNPHWVDSRNFPGMEIIEVDAEEPYAANALLTGGRLLVDAGHHRTLDRLRVHGLNPLTVEAGELAKAEGGLTCGSVIFEVA